MAVILLSCVTAIAGLYLVSGCDINTCLKNNQLHMPYSCQAYIQTLQCIKKEYENCTSHAGKAQIMMSMQYVMKSGHYCGFDVDQMTQMMTAHTGLMTSLFNGTNGMMSPMMMGDDGPFDFDDDDGPFDDGPFDDGPFDDMGGNGMFPFLAGGGAGKAGNVVPPPAPGLIPSFKGGSMMQSNEHKDYDNGAGHNGQSWWTFTLWTLCLLYLFI